MADIASALRRRHHDPAAAFEAVAAGGKLDVASAKRVLTSLGVSTTGLQMMGLATKYGEDGGRSFNYGRFLRDNGLPERSEAARAVPPSPRPAAVVTPREPTPVGRAATLGRPFADKEALVRAHESAPAAQTRLLRMASDSVDVAPLGPGRSTVSALFDRAEHMSRHGLKHEDDTAAANSCGALAADLLATSGGGTGRLPEAALDSATAPLVPARLGGFEAAPAFLRGAITEAGGVFGFETAGPLPVPAGYAPALDGSDALPRRQPLTHALTRGELSEAPNVGAFVGDSAHPLTAREGYLPTFPGDPLPRQRPVATAHLTGELAAAPAGGIPAFMADGRGAEEAERAALSARFPPASPRWKGDVPAPGEGGLEGVAAASASWVASLPAVPSSKNGADAADAGMSRWESADSDPGALLWGVPPVRREHEGRFLAGWTEAGAPVGEGAAGPEPLFDVRGRPHVTPLGAGAHSLHAAQALAAAASLPGAGSGYSGGDEAVHSARLASAREKLRRVLPEKAEAAAAVLRARLAASDGDRDGVLSAEQLMESLAALAPDVRADEVGALAAHFRRQALEEAVAGSAGTAAAGSGAGGGFEARTLGSSALEAAKSGGAAGLRDGHGERLNAVVAAGIGTASFGVGVPVADLAAWVAVEVGGRPQVHNPLHGTGAAPGAGGTLVGGTAALTEHPFDPLSATPAPPTPHPNPHLESRGAAAALAEAPLAEDADALLASLSLAGPGGTAPRRGRAGYSEQHKRKQELEAAAAAGVGSEHLPRNRKGGASPEPGDRTEWATRNARWESFKTEWSSRHGAAAKKELAFDAEMPAEGPTWTRAEPQPFQVLHLSGGAPLSARAARALGK